MCNRHVVMIHPSSSGHPILHSPPWSPHWLQSACIQVAPLFLIFSPWHSVTNDHSGTIQPLILFCHKPEAMKEKYSKILYSYIIPNEKKFNLLSLGTEVWRMWKDQLNTVSEKEKIFITKITNYAYADEWESFSH